MCVSAWLLTALLLKISCLTGRNGASGVNIEYSGADRVRQTGDRRSAVPFRNAAQSRRTFTLGANQPGDNPATLASISRCWRSTLPGPIETLPFGNLATNKRGDIP